MSNKKGYFVWLLVLSVVVFWVVGNFFKTNEPAIVFLLSLIAVHLILDKNNWIIEKLERKSKEK